MWCMQDMYKTSIKKRTFKKFPWIVTLVTAAMDFLPVPFHASHWRAQPNPDMWMIFTFFPSHGAGAGKHY